MTDSPSGTGGGKGTDVYIWIGGGLALVLAALAFVIILTPALQESYRGLFGIILVAFVAVLFFTGTRAAKASYLVQGVFSVGGAGAFFLFAVDKVEGWVFPDVNITGVVYYVDSRTPVQGVTVSALDRPAYTATSDERGVFELTGAPASADSLRFEFGATDTIAPRLPNEGGAYMVIRRPGGGPSRGEPEALAGRWSSEPVEGCGERVAPSATTTGRYRWVGEGPLEGDFDLGVRVHASRTLLWSGASGSPVQRGGGGGAVQEWRYREAALDSAVVEVCVGGPAAGEGEFPQVYRIPLSGGDA